MNMIPAGGSSPRAGNPVTSEVEGKAEALRQRGFAGTRTLALYLVTIFISAFLVFSVQPMFGKLVLPMLGGSPSVWTTAMLFFQCALLAGYGYAHLLSRLPSRRLHNSIHALLLIAAAAFLPLDVTPPSGEIEWPALWLLAAMGLSVGLPFLALSASAPLLQFWFAHSRHAQAHDPYFLYAASNLGSMLALLSYPVLVEPLLGLGRQLEAWAFAYLVLAALLFGAMGTVKTWPASAAADSAADHRSQSVPLALKLRWLALSAVPASLLLGVTTYITTDVAPAPLMWILPLALYLSTHVIVFSKRPILRHAWVVRFFPILLLASGTVALFASDIVLQVSGHLAVLFLVALLCHGELAASRPPARSLTTFYFCMSLGGALGGAFNALIAPAIFTRLLEYPIAVLAACLLRPARWEGRLQQKILDMIFPIALLLVLALPALMGWNELARQGRLAMFVLGGLAVVLASPRAMRFAPAVAALLFWYAPIAEDAHSLQRERNFFGILRVEQAKDDRHHLLYHGRILHGAQSLEPAERCKPLTYYHPKGPLGDLFSDAHRSAEWKRVAVVGLGAASTLAYSRPGEAWTLFEIDPDVVAIARDPRYFTFMSDCAGASEMKTVVGDARLALARQADASFDLMILDAYSSDAVPIHMITLEAFRLYAEKLAPGGVIAAHISNRYLQLDRIIDPILRELGFHAIVRTHKPDEDKEVLEVATMWVLASRDGSSLESLSRDPRWQTLKVADPAALWTDDYSNLLSVLK